MHPDHDPDCTPDAGKEMLEEYDFDQMPGPLHVGKYYDRYQRAKLTRVLNAEMSKEFPDNESVNKALLEYLKMKNETE